MELTVIIYYLEQHAIKKVDVKLFSSRKKAEEFLVENNFLFGYSTYFKDKNWYYRNSMVGLEEDGTI